MADRNLKSAYVLLYQRVSLIKYFNTYFQVKLLQCLFHLGRVLQTHRSGLNSRKLPLLIR